MQSLTLKLPDELADWLDRRARTLNRPNGFANKLRSSLRDFYLIADETRS
jgi:predicted transcriptional regulator